MAANMNGSSPNVPESGRTLIIGATGFIGCFVAESSLEFGRPTYLLVRPGPASPAKVATLKSLQDKGAIVIYGLISDKEFIVKVLKENKIEVVISVVAGDWTTDQLNLIEAIKAAGTVKRFLPSEFGHDIDRAQPVEPGLAMYEEKRKVRRATEAAGIPYTYICCNSIAGWPYCDNTHPAELLPPMDRFQIYGDGTGKAYFVAGTDIGKFTIKSLDDDRTINKSVHFRPPTNLVSLNEMASLWEDKIGRKLPRETITADDLLASAKEMRIPESIVAALTHDIFFNGCQVLFPLDKPTDVEVCALYPDTPLRTLDEFFNDYIKELNDNSKLAKDGIVGPNSKQDPVGITA